LQTPLQQVVAHLRRLAERTTAVGQLPADQRMRVLRDVVDQYFHADPSVLTLCAQPRSITVGERRCEWLLPAGGDPDRRLLYIHGGSWMKGGLDSHRTLAARIAEATKCSVLTLDYRLAPEHPFPAGLEDCVTTYLWMRQHGPHGPAAAGRTLIAGDSAGGNLTLASLLALKDRRYPLPDAAIALSPATDFTAGGESIKTRAEQDPILTAAGLDNCAKVYLRGRVERTNPLASPLFGDLAGLPPLLIQVGDAEILLDDSRRFAEVARSADVDVTLQVWPHMPHVFQGFAPLLPEALEAMERIREFVQRF
jgi:monoterpene epsilon-lactone hydrolase